MRDPMIARFLFALCVVSSAASAQSFNFELGPGAPPPTYGGAAQQPGPWNVINVPGQSYLFDAGVSSAVDVNGVVTSVSANFHSTAYIFWADTYLYTFVTGPQHAALLADGLDGDWIYGYVDFEINGLQPGV